MCLMILKNLLEYPMLSGITKNVNPRLATNLPLNTECYTLFL